MSSAATLACDVAIIGAGPVGSALGLALRESGLAICLLEARPMKGGAMDARSLALSYGSRLLLDRAGVWHGLDGVSPIRTIHVSSKNFFGQTILRATEATVPDLGYVLPYADLLARMRAALKPGGIKCLDGAIATRITAGTGQATVTFLHDAVESTLRARLVVVADGGKLLDEDFPPSIREYGQSAVIAHVTCTRPLAQTAFERFTAHGPVALLPYRDGYELVWTAPHAIAQEMMGWEDKDFLARLHQHFGDRVGAFQSVGQRTSFPLRYKRAVLRPPGHTVLIGNAAQTLHPVAGQGLNLGLRDAWELAQHIMKSGPDNLGTAAMLEAYDKQRRWDRTAGSCFTDGLVRAFSNDLPLIGRARAAALTVLDCLPAAKKIVARRMMFGANG